MDKNRKAVIRCDYCSLSKDPECGYCLGTRQRYLSLDGLHYNAPTRRDLKHIPALVVRCMYCRGVVSTYCSVCKNAGVLVLNEKGLSYVGIPGKKMILTPGTTFTYKCTRACTPTGCTEHSIKCDLTSTGTYVVYIDGNTKYLFDEPQLQALLKSVTSISR